MKETQNGFVIYSPGEVVEAFSKMGKHIITLAGFSALGYQDEKLLEQLVTERILDQLDAEQIIINIGVTADGIGAAYEWAVARKFGVTGIVSSCALEYADFYSPHLLPENCFFVEDEGWGGYLEGSENLSPVSEAMVLVSDGYVAFGGGEIASDELRESKKRKKEWRYFSLEMNHEKARERARKKAQPEPVQFFGPLHEEFEPEVI